MQNTRVTRCTDRVSKRRGRVSCVAANTARKNCRSSPHEEDRVAERNNLDGGFTVPNRAIVFYTSTTMETILEEGGIGWWRLNPNRAQECAFALLTRNTSDRRAWASNDRGPESRYSAFLIGRICGLTSSFFFEGEDRYFVRLSQYARVNIANAWKGGGTPIKYATLDEYGIDPSTLTWEPMPSHDSRLGSTGDESIVAPPPDLAPLTIAEAKERLELDTKT